MTSRSNIFNYVRFSIMRSSIIMQIMIKIYLNYDNF